MLLLQQQGSLVMLAHYVLTSLALHVRASVCWGVWPLCLWRQPATPCSCSLCWQPCTHMHY